MKTMVLFTALTVLCTSAVFAQDGAGGFSLSAGSGGSIGGHFTRYRIQAGEGEASFRADQNVNLLEGGAFAFLDATYATLYVGFLGGTGTFDEPVTVGGQKLDDFSRSGRGWESSLGVSLLGRYPFALGERLTLFPLLGMDWHLALSQRRTDGPAVYDRTNPPAGSTDAHLNGNFKISDWNVLFVRLGAGASFDLTDRLFLRGDLLYGIRLMSRQEKLSLETVKTLTEEDSPKLGGLSSGPTVRIGLGWRIL
ncbi:MAG: hypothetical protein FWD94_05930 [Treponema sp.]|nr:hypothetical protein [Treponema sp.]